jgi:GMP synthase-like glutamine amidotransferase
MRVLCVHHEEPIRGGTYDSVIPEAGHEVARWAPFAGEPAPQLDSVDAIVVYGGAVHPDADDTDPWLADETALVRRALDERVPLLGLCLGAQLIARASGAWVGPAPASEVGWVELELTDEGRQDPVLRVVPDGTVAFEWHHYSYAVPDDAVELARSASCTQAFRLGDRVWGVQFHPEVTREMAGEWIGLAPDQVPGSPDELLAENAANMTGWNAVGRRLCKAFLAVADTR